MADDGEFQMVSRKKACRPRKQKAQNQRFLNASTDEGVVDKGRFKQRLQVSGGELRTYGLWSDVNKVLQSALLSETTSTMCGNGKDFKSKQDKGQISGAEICHPIGCLENSRSVDEADGQESSISYPWEDIVCYGLGKFTTCHIARYQLALLMLLIENIKPKNCYVYDPMFSVVEKEILQELGSSVIVENEEGKRLVTKETLFFMPHCGKPLYNNLLWANWGEPLKNVVIIGNSFSAMEQNMPSRILKEKFKYINAVLPFMKEGRVTPGARFSDVFNDTSLHVFRLPSSAEDVWKCSEEPNYDINDVEIILNK